MSRAAAPHHHHDHHHHHHQHGHGLLDRPALEDADLLEAAFIDGFRHAADKTSFLRLAGIPFERELDGDDLKLVRVGLNEEWEVGSVSRGFGSETLVYQPRPERLVERRTRLVFVYVSARGVRELTFTETIAGAGPAR